MSSTEMKSYLSLIPISAKVRRRQNRMTILCIVIAVFLVSAIFSVSGQCYFQCSGYDAAHPNESRSRKRW